MLGVAGSWCFSAVRFWGSGLRLWGLWEVLTGSILVLCARGSCVNSQDVLCKFKVPLALTDLVLLAVHLRICNGSCVPENCAWA